VEAPFRTFRLFIVGFLAISCGLGTLFATSQLIGALGHAPNAYPMKDVLQTFGIDVGARPALHIAQTAAMSPPVLACTGRFFTTLAMVVHQNACSITLLGLVLQRTPQAPPGAPAVLRSFCHKRRHRAVRCRLPRAARLPAPPRLQGARQADAAHGARGAPRELPRRARDRQDAAARPPPLVLPPRHLLRQRRAGARSMLQSQTSRGCMLQHNCMVRSWMHVKALLPAHHPGCVPSPVTCSWCST
jgi:Low psii accumulation1 / Rep27